MKSRIKGAVIAVLILAFAIFIVTEAAIVYDGLTDETDRADVALILGNTVNEDGTPSARLRGRLARGLSLYQDATVGRIMVSGGLGKEGHWEGDAMAAYLVEHGVPEEKILIDNGGVNTMASAANFVARQGREGYESVIVVSQFFHISRCRLALNRMGVQDVGTAHATAYELRDVYGTVREFAAYYAYLFARPPANSEAPS